MTEPEFLNSLSGTFGCGPLLDLHNVHTNAINHGLDPFEFVDSLDPCNVREIHIAGGNAIAGIYMDSHAGPCPDRVWDLLERVVPKTPELLGITFEFHESYYPVLQEDGVRRQLAKARHIWERQMAPVYLGLSESVGGSVGFARSLPRRDRKFGQRPAKL